MGLNDEIESTLDWWSKAGADTIVGDEPGSWLKPPAEESKIAAAAAALADPAKASALPSTPSSLDEFRQWMLDSDIVPAARAARCDAEGDPSSGLMIVLDMPEAGDAEAGHLLMGEAGMLFDRMLAAIGRDRASAYLATMSPARPPGGGIDDALEEKLAEAVRRHAELAAPKWLLAMGDAPSRAFCGANLNTARGKQPILNHDGGKMAVIATFHPRFLLRQPAFKAQSWKDLQMLSKGMSA